MPEHGRSANGRGRRVWPTAPGHRLHLRAGPGGRRLRRADGRVERIFHGGVVCSEHCAPMVMAVTVRTGALPLVLESDPAPPRPPADREIAVFGPRFLVISALRRSRPAERHRTRCG